MPPFAAVRSQFGIPNVPQSMTPVRSFSDTPFPSLQYGYTIAGTMKDSTGVALAGCTVKLYRTTNDTVSGIVVSDGSGNYKIAASSELRHYLVAYLPGSPDVAGTTVNTIVGT